ncbi:MAG: response regulator [Deltaproteobacteria bacterium]|nr:response regulator [Deltaproteobacteria bacterium]MBW1794243.1 response regulator [Deltaproteobacteria bacterium]MBW2330034.1 response regulator [Deltaproteobacteria bacterium]
MKEMQDRYIRTVIVDDDRTIGDILKDLISKEHISVEVFNDSLEAVKSITREPVDVVITDLMMPRISGLEVLRQAKVMNPEVVVIIITGHGSLETAIEAIREGAYDYIKKPFKLQEMEIVFKNAVEKVNLIREKTQLLKELKEAYDQLVAIKKERDKGDLGQKAEQDRIARLNFFSSDRPGLHLMRSAPMGEPNYFEQLENISMLKRDGLLTEKEFKTLKAHLMKGLKTHE